LSRAVSRDNVYIDNRSIYLSENFNNETVGKINSNLLSLINEDDEKDRLAKDYKREPIHIYISSYGGSVYDLFGLIDIIENSKTPIYTYCYGYAMSCGFILFLSGHKRFMSKRSFLMCHTIASGSYGQLQYLKEDLVQLEKINKIIQDYIISRSSITIEQLEDIETRKYDWYIDAQEAKMLKIVEEIL